MTIGELLDLHVKRTPGRWRWSDGEIVADHEGHMSTVALGGGEHARSAWIDIDPPDAAIIVAAVNALGPLLAMLVAVERAADSEDEHSAMDDVRDAARAARRAIEQTP